jgi:predicted Zn finger-like uncharacterized protein
MPSETFPCPQCQATLRVQPGVITNTGDLVECPRCRHQFPVPTLDTSAGPAAPPLEPLRGLEFSETPGPGRRKLADIDGPERISELPRRPSIAYDDEDYPRGRYGDELDRRGPLSNEYTIDLGDWFSYGTAHFGSVIGPAVGFGVLFFFFILIVSFIPCIGPLAQILVQPPLQAGLTVVCLTQLKGRPWTFGDFFSGFNWWGNLVGLNILASIGAVIIMIPSILISFVVLSGAPRGPGPAEGAIAFSAIALNLIVLLYFGIRLTFFAIPLIIDRGFSVSEAMQGSWTLSKGHFWGLFGVAFLLGIINIALITIPLTMLIQTAGYLLIAGTQKPLKDPASLTPDEYERVD